jgi:hypothetical protein
MDWQLIGYSLACVIVPIAWGLVVVWISNRLDALLLRNGRSGRGRKPARPIEYHI